MRDDHGFRPRYVYPRGFGYHAWRRGDRFPRSLISGYMLGDYAYYDLAPPPQPSCEWVRYGPDAVLIDTYTGQVIDVAYGVFADSSDDASSAVDGGYPDAPASGVAPQGYPYGDRYPSYPPPRAPDDPYRN